MYEWRKMTAEQREATLKARKERGNPWHSPPHEDYGEGYYLITAACYEHKPVIGTSVERLGECSDGLLELMEDTSARVCAWCVLPNHYHFLVYSGSIMAVLDELKLFHGRKAFKWNGEDDARGRTVFRNCTERKMRSEGHFRATESDNDFETAPVNN